MGWLDARMPWLLPRYRAVDSVQYMPYDLSPQTEQLPEQHLERIEQAIASADAGRLRPLEAGDWERLRQVARDVADRNARDCA